MHFIENQKTDVDDLLAFLNPYFKKNCTKKKKNFQANVKSYR